MKNTNGTIAVVGATGYVGGRLVTKLLDEGYRVKAIGRSIEKMRGKIWSRHPNIELTEADVLNRDSLKSALKEIDSSYYLVHSMNHRTKDYAESDRIASENFASAAAENNLNQIIYLGGLGNDKDSLSDHLKSRREVESILNNGAVPVTVLRAAMIIGSGSASFEILRYLVNRLPVMITPKWVNTPSQPIAIRNVLNYLTGVLGNTKAWGKTFDIGGPDILTYESLMRIYAHEAGLPRRWIIRVPVLTPRLSSYWIHLVTPVPASIAKPLAEGLKNPVVCNDNDIRDIVPEELLSPGEAIRFALQKTGGGSVESSWIDAGEAQPAEWATVDDAEWAGGTIYRDERTLPIKGSPDAVWNTVESIGGKNGWYHANFLWILRGVLDRMVGGVGLRRGRRDQKHLSCGDALDFWRVIQIDKGKRLLLCAEMKLPGKATLEFKITGDGNGQKNLVQTALFEPKGLFGILYWFLVSPLHHYVFGGMIRKIIRRSEPS